MLFKSRSLNTLCGMLPRFTYEFTRRAVHNATIAEVGILSDQDPVILIGDARDILIGCVPTAGKPVHVLALMIGLG